MAEPPQGTVTFLFTDIQGSTRQWERQPEEMKVALERHDALLRSLVETHRGFVFKTVGDAFCVAFDAAEEGVRAAIAIQHALERETWPEGIQMAVRMGLHSGSASFRDNDYFGPAVNRVARIEAAAHGGQILVSQSTSELISDAVPTGVSLRDMGSHRLKDIANPELIFQVIAPGLADEFPAIRTLTAQRTNLPADLTPLVGRERETLDVRSLVVRPDVRLVTLSGPGGTGKTRLSLAVARGLIDDLEDGVFFVELETVRDPQGIVPAIARAVGVSLALDRSPLDSLAEALADKKMLLVLDNLEQVVSGADRVSGLLDRCSGLSVIASSRHILNVYGEHEYPVQPLAVPEPSARLSPAVAAQYPAVALFLERAARIRPGFELTESNQASVIDICRALDGLPLAIELAVARLRLLTPEKIRDRLTDSLSVLASRRRDVSARQATMRGAIDWSYDLLDDVERRAYERLALFRSGFSFDAAEHMLSDLDVDPIDAIESLLEKSLVRPIDSAQGTERFSMFAVIAEYGREKLAAAGHDAYAYRLFADFFLSVATFAMGEGVENVGVILIDESPNIVAANDWAVESGDHSLALEVIVLLSQPFSSDLAIAPKVSRWLEEMVRAEVLKDREYRGALRTLGNIRYQTDDKDAARELWIRSRDLAREAGDDDGVAKSSNNLAVLLAAGPHDHEEVITLLQDVIDASERLGQFEGAGRSYANLATEYLAMGKPEVALEKARRSEKLVGDSATRYWPIRVQSEALFALGQAREAFELYHSSMSEWWAMTQHIGAMIGFLRLGARIALRASQPDLAARILGGLLSLPDRGVRLSRTETEDTKALESEIGEALSEAELENARAQGAELEDAEIVDLALSLNPHF